MSDEGVFLLKARALLLPSPYEAVDPDGEAARAAEIERWLEAAGAGADEEGRSLLARCAADARDAQVPPQALPEGPPRLVHPLSAELIRKDFAIQPIKDWLAMLPRREGGQSAKAWYFKLWRCVMVRSDALADLPGSGLLPDHTVWAHRNLTAALAGARARGKQPAALMYLHVGPVQGFIAAARRTHDLWIGSYTVSFLAFQAVRALAEELGPDAVVYPDPTLLPLADKLLFGEEPAKEELLRSSLPNKLLAIVAEDDAERLAEKAAQAVSRCWARMGERAKALLQKGMDSAARAAKEESRTLLWDPALPAWQAFEEQLADHLELDAVIQPWPEDRATVRGLLQAAHRLMPAWLDGDVMGKHTEGTGVAYGVLFDLAYRTLTAQRRAVAPPAGQGDQRPKCTVCGIREQMGPLTSTSAAQQRASRAFFTDLSQALQELETTQGDDNEQERLSLQIASGEGLCAVCLTKRFAPQAFYGGDDGAGLGLSWRDSKHRPFLRFPSVASVASAPLRFYLKNDPYGLRLGSWLAALEELHGRNHLNFAPPGNLLPGLGEVGDRSALLGFDGTWLYESAYAPDAAFRSHCPDAPQVERDKAVASLKGPLKRAAREFRTVCQAAGAAASTYYAVLMLDGDRMGQWLTGQHESTPTFAEINPAVSQRDGSKRRPLYPALHGELSRRLGRLALELHTIVSSYLGRVVYSGGDDLLALLPLQTALPCLAAIRTALRTPEHLGNRVTFSAGLAIAHWHDPLGRTLTMAREAEHDAKASGRDSVALRIDKRSGAPLRLVLPWTLKPNALDPRPLWAPVLRPGVELEVIEALMDLLGANEANQERPLDGTKAAYQLEQELPTLGRLELREAFVHRLDMLLGLTRRELQEKGARQARVLLRALLAAWDARLGDRDLPRQEVERRARDNARRLVDLLLFACFLAREEHGIVTKQLLEALDALRGAA